MFTNNSAPDEGTDDDPARNSSLFTAATSTPKKKKKSKSEKSKKKKEEKRAAESPVKSSTHTIFHDEMDCDAAGIGDLPTVLEHDYPETSNDSFDISTIQKQAQKLAMMLQQGRQSRKAGSLQTYNGPLIILDDQQTYEFEITRRFEPFDLKPDPTGARTIVDYSDTEKRIKQMCLEIKFEAFCNEFKNNYVGEEDDDELLNHTVEKIREDQERIKMNYMNRSTGHMIYTSPETVFKKMNAFIELLPTDASGWSFFLPWLFFAALPSDLQEEMKNKGFTRPPVATLNTKKLQARALGQCRDSAVKAYNKLQETKKQVRTMIQGQQCIPGQGNNCNYLGVQEEGEMHDEYETMPHEQAHIYAYQQKSRAETAMQNAHNQRKHHEMLPAGFEQKNKLVNGAEYPCHPNDESRSSAFPVGFRGCFYCGDRSHGFQNCRRKEESDAVTVFHWNLHYHKPELWFKHKDRRAAASGNQQANRVQFHPQAPIEVDLPHYQHGKRGHRLM